MGSKMYCLVSRGVESIKQASKGSWVQLRFTFSRACRAPLDRSSPSYILAITASKLLVTVARSWRGLSANLTIKFRNFGKKFRYFFRFSWVCDKVSFWKRKLVLHVLFPLNKVVF
jgi:hypothetical protein